MVGTGFEPSKRQLRYFDISRRASLQSELRSRHGSTLVRAGRALAVGFNEDRYFRQVGPVRENYWTLHSELAATLALTVSELAGADVYNYRETRTGERADSAPCDLCQRVLTALGIKRVFYTTYEGYGCVKL